MLRRRRSLILGLMLSLVILSDLVRFGRTGVMNMSVDMIPIIGGAYAALQGIAQFLMMILPQKTIAWKVSKYLVSGPARPTDTAR